LLLLLLRTPRLLDSYAYPLPGVPPAPRRPRASMAENALRSPARAGRRQHVRIDDVDRPPRRKGEDLVENVRELRLVFLARHIADVRRRDDLFELQQRQIGIAHRLVLEHVDRGTARPARAPRPPQRARPAPGRAAGTDHHGGGPPTRQNLWLGRTSGPRPAPAGHA